MSRTIRRKNCSVPEHWLQDYCYDEDYGFFKYVDYPEKRRNWELKKMHLDIGCTVDNAYVPKSYKKDLYKTYRRKTNREVNRIWRQNDFDEYCFDKYHLDAAYTYW